MGFPRSPYRWPSQSETIGYRLANGECRFVRWLGFIERTAARELDGARPVRLVWISRLGYQGAIHMHWPRDVADDEAVLGCLVEQGAYAVYDQIIATVPARKPDG